MNLDKTPRAKEDFEKFWLNYEMENEILDWIYYKDFYKLPLSMKFGVFVDYAESKGYYADILCIEAGYEVCIWRFFNHKLHRESDIMDYITLNEARQTAVEKLFELIEKELK